MRAADPDKHCCVSLCVSVRMCVQMELLEVRRVQEEGEKKRQALPTESLLVDGATQQRSEEFHQYHSPDSKHSRQIIGVHDFILALIS